MTTENVFKAVAAEVLQLPPRRRWGQARENATMLSFFGVSMSIAAKIWDLIQPQLDDEKCKMKHLLWALVFIKCYDTEAVLCRIVGWVDPKEYRTWVWYILKRVAALLESVILLDSRFDNWDGSSICLISIDGTDCPVMEPWPFDGRWYSKKFNGPGVKYEIGVCIATGHIVWVNGPFEASKNDSAIFNDTLDSLLCDDEGVEVDQGYKGNHRFKSPTVASSRSARKMKSVVRGRHEIVNSKLKTFEILNRVFRHSGQHDGGEAMKEKHGICFHAIAVLTQLKIAGGETIFDVPYHVDYS